MLNFTELSCPAAGPEELAAGSMDPQLWLACAGSMCTVPPVGAAVYYFPQGHAEQAIGAVDLSAARVPALVACRVAAVRFMAEAQSDEVFAKIRLVPLRPGDAVVDVGAAANLQDEQAPKPASFAKTLTQSDANNGGGFSVPRFCAETIFPPLDYSEEPPVQNIFVRDVHGEEFKFRHIYRGTPRRHLLTTGWSNFVNQKKLLAGDSIVFLRGEAGDVHVGIRRAKRVFCTGDGHSGWDHYRGLTRGSGNAEGGGAKGKFPAEDVIAAARLAATGQPFEVVYYPRMSTPEFCVRAGAVRAAMQVQWCPGMRFKMAFETEDSSRISWFMGTVAGVHAADPSRWPHSFWRLLQVTWDEPELLQNVKRVCPWLVELVSSMPNLHLPSFSPPRKKPRIPSYTDFPFDGQLFHRPPPSFPPNHHPLAHHHDQLMRHSIPVFPFPDNNNNSGAPLAGVQGARHAQFVPSFPDLHISNLPYSGARRPAAPDSRAPGICTDLTIGTSPVREDTACTAKEGRRHRQAADAAALRAGDTDRAADEIQQQLRRRVRLAELGGREGAQRLRGRLRVRRDPGGQPEQQQYVLLEAAGVRGQQQPVVVGPRAGAGAVQGVRGVGRHRAQPRPLGAELVRGAVRPHVRHVQHRRRRAEEPRVVPRRRG